MGRKARHIVITGAAGGIGAALAAHFLQLDWQVTAIDVRRDMPSELVDHGRFIGVKADIRDENDMQAAFDQAAGRAPIDAVIGNAAVTDPEHRHAVDMPYGIWKTIMRVNIDGAFLTARCAARRMRLTGGGNIVFVTSSLARLPDAQAGDAPYCTSKAAVEMLARVLAAEFKPDGINVNTLFPSVMIDTGFFAHWPDAERRALSPATTRNDTAAFLAMVPAGAITGRSLDQSAWDHDPVYRATWEAEP